ncbi:TetR/AcrR family transcriptional regulator (plasmid) [Streptomyces sp. AHU1]|uniref:TetR/AcrR family transcriptional regulator n=1 Tax=Streptomyces sp. AHU1 TaxID=3377215 RepID=UPI003877A0CE
MTNPPRAAGARSAAPGRKMRADAHHNREKLFQAARSVFAENPQGARMDEIAQRAGVGIATLFRNFPRRIDLIEALYREEIIDLQNLAEDLCKSRDPWDALAEWLRALATFTFSKRTLFAELSPAFERDPNFAEESYRQLHSAARTVFDRAKDAGELENELRTADIIQLVGGISMNFTAEPTRTDYLLEIILKAIRAPGAGTANTYR